jgi:hypothetical protein
MARYYPLKPGAARPVTMAEVILPAGAPREGQKGEKGK